MTKEIKDLIIETLEIEDVEEIRLYADTAFVLFEGNSKKDKEEIRFGVFDWTNNIENALEKYKSGLKKLKADLIAPVMVFEDLDSETEKFYEYYDKVNAKEKNELQQMFDEKISVFTKLKNDIEIKVEDNGINFLEYKKAEGVEGYIYNVSFWELKKIFNATGKKVFDENIRYGMKKEYSGNIKLKSVFYKYLIVGLYDKLCAIDYLDGEKLSDLFGEDFDEDVINITDRNKFWFYHNGVTIYTTADHLTRKNNKIIMNPNNISIINGAQTMTYLYDNYYEIKRRCENTGKDLSVELLLKCLDDVCKDIMIKTIIIKGTQDDIYRVSEGLNTQIPIKEEDIIAAKEEVSKINKEIKKYDLQIRKVGEFGCENDISVLEFVKWCKMIDGKPGTAKNFRKNQISGYIKEIQKNIKDIKYAKLSYISQIEEWWGKNLKEKKKYNESDDKDEKQILRYSKNYFISFVLSYDNNQIDTANFDNLYIKFIDLIKNVRNSEGIEIESKVFKNDTLFEEIITQKGKLEKEEINIEINTTEITEYVNSLLGKSNNSKSAVNKIIAKYLGEHGINLKYFRTISVTMENKVKESYSLPIRTFSEIYEKGETKIEDFNYIPFNESAFFKEINRKYPVFVVKYKENGKIDGIRYIKQFSLMEYSEAAKEVYYKTIETFRSGNEDEFVKISDKECFHVRTRAQNADDTFLFSNGKQITKRTFWVNADVIQRIIDDETVYS